MDARRAPEEVQLVQLRAAGGSRARAQASCWVRQRKEQGHFSQEHEGTKGTRLLRVESTMTASPDSCLQVWTTPMSKDLSPTAKMCPGTSVLDRILCNSEARQRH